MEFDLAAIDTKTLSDAGVVMPVKRLDGAPLLDRHGNAVTMTLLGPDSDKYRAITRAQVRRRLARLADSGGKPADADIDSVETETLDVLVACTIGWVNVRTPDGAEIPFSTEAARALYAKYPVIVEQVDRFIASRVNFLAASPSN